MKQRTGVGVEIPATFATTTYIWHINILTDNQKLTTEAKVRSGWEP